MTVPATERPCLAQGSVEAGPYGYVVVLGPAEEEGAEIVHAAERETRHQEAGADDFYAQEDRVQIQFSAE
jgi:hypothetical protein